MFSGWSLSVCSELHSSCNSDLGRVSWHWRWTEWKSFHHNFFWKRTEIILDISNIPSDDCDDDKGNVENDDVEADRVLVMLRRQEMHPRWNSGGGTNQGPGGTLFNYQKEHVMPTAGVGLIAPSASSKLFYLIFYSISIFEFINFGGLVIGQNLKKKKKHFRL